MTNFNTTSASTSTQTVNNTNTTKGNTMQLIHNGSALSNFDSTAYPVTNVQAFATRFLALLSELKCAKAVFTKMASAHNTYVVSYNFNNVWELTIPAAALVELGQYDVKGNADLNTSSDNPIQLIVNFMRVAAKGDLKALTEYRYKTNIQSVVSQWVEDKINSSTVASQRGMTGFYSKAIADWRVPTTVKVGEGLLPVVYVSAESPVFYSGNKTFTENEIVMVTRSPIPFSVAAVVKVAPFHMDANVVCVNPLVMDVNHGDNDGDALTLTSMRANGTAVSVYQAMKFNMGKFSIGGYQTANELSTTLAEVATVASLSPNSKVNTKFTNKFFNIHNEVIASEWSTNLAFVNEVYSKHVAKAYDIAFSAHMEMVTRLEAGDTTFSAEEMGNAVAYAWGVYEDKALCGYSAKTFDFVDSYIQGNTEECSFLSSVIENVIFGSAAWSMSQELDATNEFALAARAIRISTKKFKSADRKLILARRKALAAVAAKLPTNTTIQLFAQAQAGTLV